MGALVSAIAVGAGLTYWLQPRSSGPPPGPVGRFLVEVAARPPDAGPLTSVAVSPDGQWLAVQAAFTSGDTRVHLRRLDQPAFEPVPGTDGARGQFWSPDSRTLAFYVGRTLKRVDIGNAGVTTIGDVDTVSGNQGSSWGSAGDILISRRGRALNRVNGSGGVPRTAHELEPGDGEHLAPVFLPDGQRYFYLAVRQDRVETRLAALDSTEMRVLEGFSGRVLWTGDTHIVFRREGALYAQSITYSPLSLVGDPALLAADVGGLNPITIARSSVSNSGVLAYVVGGNTLRQFTWFGRDGRPRGTVGPPATYSGFDLSTDGTRLAFVRPDESADNLWMMDTATGATSRVTVGPAQDVDPRLSPSATEVIFGSSRGGARSPFRAALDGKPPTRVFPFKGVLALDDWSADGRWLLFHNAGQSVLEALRVDRSDGEPVEVARALTGAVDQAQMSSDGRWICFQSNESGRFEIYVVPFPPTGDRWQVSRNGGAQPTWRGDERELYFLAEDGTLMAAGIGAGTAFHAEEPRALFKTSLVPVNYGVEEYAPAPDGSRFLVLDPVGGQPNLTISVLTNWPALLDRPPR
jgi:Tol biopolymer transport system component